MSRFDLASRQTRIVATWCAARHHLSYVAVLLTVEDGYYLSCRRWHNDLSRYVEFDGCYRERGEFHETEEADKWAVSYFRVPMKQAFPVDMTECSVELLTEMRRTT